MGIDEIFCDLRAEGNLTPVLRQEILDGFGDRGRKALKAIDERRVKRYLDFIIVVGTTDEYIVDEDFCSCRDFIFRKGHCWHVLAAAIAVITGDYEKVDLWYMDTWSEENPPDKQYLS
jgi:predicted nucleic acid-binding Zn finger protein